MKINHFEDTDTLYIQLNNNEIVDTYDASSDMIVDVDANADVVAMTIEHASQKSNLRQLEVLGINLAA